jgi:hypothetical protein
MMIKKLLLITATVLTIQFCNARSIPFVDFGQPPPVNTMSLALDTIGSYFGKTPPGTTPQLFAPEILSVPGVVSDVTRIAFSPDGNECFFSGTIITGGSTGTRMFYKKCVNNVWTATVLAPFFPDNSCRQPYFSAGGDTLYFSCSRNGTSDIYMVVRASEGWGTPQVLPDPINSSSYDGMYTQAPDGTIYIESDRPGGQGGIDVWRISPQQPGQPQQVENLGLPINTSTDNNDPFVSPDGRYIIFGSEYNDLFVTFHKGDNNWTTPVNLNKYYHNISTNQQEYAPFISTDGRYLFFTRISEGGIFWVSASYIDSSNFPPYVNRTIPDQVARQDSVFNFQIPDNSFIDDNGNNSLTFTASLDNGNPLPLWLSFDSIARTFSGTPTEAAIIGVKVTATDTAYANISCTFQISVSSSTSDNQFEKQKIRVFPNPADDALTIYLGSDQYKEARIEISGLSGKQIFSKSIHGLESETIDMSGFSKGVYLISIIVDGKKLYNEKIYLK